MGFSGCPRDITSKTETLARAGFGATSVNCPRDIASHRYVTSLAALRDIASQNWHVTSLETLAAIGFPGIALIPPSSSCF